MYPVPYASAETVRIDAGCEGVREEVGHRNTAATSKYLMFYLSLMTHKRHNIQTTISFSVNVPLTSMSVNTLKKAKQNTSALCNNNYKMHSDTGLV